MFARACTFRPHVAAVVMAVLTTLSVVVPLLDQGRHLGGERLAEAGTPPGYVDHHHGVCLQHSAAAWSPAKGAELPSAVQVRENETFHYAALCPGRSARSLHHSRAPPVA